MALNPSDGAERAAHWAAVYERQPVDALSWWQEAATTSLELLDLLQLAPDASVIDIGGGASVFVDALVSRGFGDVTVLDLSASALATSRARLPEDAPVTWEVADLLTFTPTRQFDLWHDRAVLHFLHGDQVDTYRSQLERTLAPGGAVIVAAFALDGPESCSGLPVTRYDHEGLLAALGPNFTAVGSRRTLHHTPGGAVQPFTWIAARRTSR